MIRSEFQGIVLSKQYNSSVQFPDMNFVTTLYMYPELFTVIFKILQKETRYQENWKKAITLLDCKQNKENNLAIVDS